MKLLNCPIVATSQAIHLPSAFDSAKFVNLVLVPRFVYFFISIEGDRLKPVLLLTCMQTQL